VEEILRQEGVEKVCRQAQENRELFEFCHLKKYPLRDLHWVGYPEGSARRLLEQRTRKVFVFSICGRRKENKIPQGV
jgi:hypothetical protein